MAPALNQNGDSRPNLPAPQAPSGASNQQAIGGVPGSVGLPLNQISEPSKSLDPIAEDPSDANSHLKLQHLDSRVFLYSALHSLPAGQAFRTSYPQEEVLLSQEV
ncbi:hypothetical protein Fot_22012 [Forsythia ovata]|uniref:Uncharacterized protein n=1 Tax=Forsythia ovata TaxID=205694 RepID=A0ABD1UWG8_9LAMI